MAVDRCLGSANRREWRHPAAGRLARSATPVALDLYGFRLEISRIGFGSTDDGRRWVGFSAGVHLVDFLPTGVSVEGLRITWDPTGHVPVQVTLQGVGLELTLPGVLTLDGDVAFVNEDVERYFKGNVKLALLSLGITLDASIKVGRNLEEDYKFVYTFMDVTLPVGVPLFATGAALYGISGMYGMNVNPSATNGDWYGWCRSTRAAQRHQRRQVDRHSGRQGHRRGPDDRHAVRPRACRVGEGSLRPGAARSRDHAAREGELPADAPGQRRCIERRRAQCAGGARWSRGHAAAECRCRLEPVAGDRHRGVSRSLLRFFNPRNWHFYLGQNTPEDRASARPCSACCTAMPI